MKRLAVALVASLLLSFLVAQQIINVLEASNNKQRTERISLSQPSLLSPTPTSTIAAVISSPLLQAASGKISPTVKPTLRPSPSVIAAISPTVPVKTTAGRTIKVMPLGDSITDGALIPGGYRNLLVQLLEVNDHDNIDFVGSQWGGAGEDRDHEGHIGWDMNQLDVYASNWMRLYQPDIVLLHIGSNDLDKGATSAELIQRMTKLLGDIYAGKPDTYVVIATIIPSNHGNKEAWSTYNAAIPGVAAQFSGSHKIIVVNMANALSEGDLIDGLHPNQGGYNKMAYVWYPTVSMLYRQMH